MNDSAPGAGAWRVLALVPALVLASVGCSSGPGPAPGPAPRAPGAGSERGPAVHVLERHSSALLRWRDAGAADRIVVHLDAHAGIDWLPDETIARIAATSPAEISALESDPFVPESNPLARFSSGDFLYAASRLGIAREVVWVVPDDTLASADGARRIVQDVLIGRLQSVTEQDARSFHRDGSVLRGTILGIPLTVCRLADLPRLDEPVLLDIDLGFFTIRSAVEPSADPVPWILPTEAVRTLRARGVQPEIITIALSTITGAVPPESRWLARDLRRLLHDSGEVEGAERTQAEARMEGLRAETEGNASRSVTIYRELAGVRADDGSVFYVLARALDSVGRTLEAASARARAERLDPLLTRAELFEAERLWLNGDWDAALIRYTAFAQDRSDEGAAAWVLRRRAGCLLRLGRQDEALAAYRELVARVPQCAEAQAELGALLHDRRETPEALAHLGEARRLGPEVASYAYALGSALLQGARFEEGVRELDAALALRPCYVQARWRLAVAFASVGRVEEARHQALLALALQPASQRLRVLARQLGARDLPAAPPGSAAGRP